MHDPAGQSSVEHRLSPRTDYRRRAHNTRSNVGTCAMFWRHRSCSPDASFELHQPSCKLCEHILAQIICVLLLMFTNKVTGGSRASARDAHKLKMDMVVSICDQITSHYRSDQCYQPSNVIHKLHCRKHHVLAYIPVDIRYPSVYPVSAEKRTFLHFRLFYNVEIHIFVS
jgi:hypothetical protein